MRLSMSIEVAVSDVKEAALISDFIKEKFNKSWDDIIICGEHPFYSYEDFKEEDPK